MEMIRSAPGDGVDSKPRVDRKPGGGVDRKLGSSALTEVRKKVGLM
jgi:hypothetical protein